MYIFFRAQINRSARKLVTYWSATLTVQLGRPDFSLDLSARDVLEVLAWMFIFLDKFNIINSRTLIQQLIQRTLLVRVHSNSELNSIGSPKSYSQSAADPTQKHVRKCQTHKRHELGLKRFNNFQKQWIYSKRFNYVTRAQIQ